MNVVVLNGSPKEESVTIQYIKYIQIHFAEVDLKIFNIAKDINKLHNEFEYFSEIIRSIELSDGVIWAFPTYIMMIPSQLKSFIEMIFENKVEFAFNNKYSAALTTSIHFFDKTACNYINGICDDLNMNYIDEFTAGINDLTEPEKQRNLLNFAEYFFNSIKNKVITPKNNSAIIPQISSYTPRFIDNVPKKNNHKVVLLTDEANTESNLSKMINVFEKLLPYNLIIKDINKINIKGGCIGCLNCSYDNKCVFNDDVKKFIQETIADADAVILAGTIRDRYLSSRWKMFFDRSFAFGHIPVIAGKCTGFIISGPLRQIPNLRLIFEAYAQNNFGFVTDESDSSEKITLLLDSLAKKLVWSVESNYRKPESFLGLSSHLIFRDLIYRNKGVFAADHFLFKKNKLYDYPYKNVKKRILNIVIGIPAIRRKIQKQIIKAMVKPLKEVLKDSVNSK